MSYRIQKINQELFDNTKSAWSLIVGSEVFTSELGALFEWIDCHRTYDKPMNGDSLAYALVAGEQKVAAGFMEVVSSPNKGGMTKLLKVFITPQYWEVKEHENEVVNIFIAAINGSLSISSQVKSKTVKIYGRTDSLLDLLIKVHDTITKSVIDQSSQITSSIGGRWLEISINK